MFHLNMPVLGDDTQVDFTKRKVATINSQHWNIYVSSECVSSGAADVIAAVR